MFKGLRNFVRVLAFLAILLLLAADLPAGLAAGPNARLLWNTFLGPTGPANPSITVRDVAVDPAGNIYIVGDTHCVWDLPGTCLTSDYLGFVAKLNNSGVRQWITFLGSRNNEVPPGTSLHLDYAFAVVLDTRGNVYVGGTSYASWGTPIKPHAGSDDGFVAKLDGNGVLQWNTFFGSSAMDEAWDLDVDAAGNAYVLGWGNAPWAEPPLNPIAGGYDAYVAKLDPDGQRLWYTFLGSPAYDNAAGLAVDPEGNTYITGTSDARWGNPRRPYTDAGVYVAMLNPQGGLVWNTFTGGSSYFSLHPAEIAVDASRNIYLTGMGGPWGNGLVPFVGTTNVFLAKFSSNGDELWHTYMGSDGVHEARDLTVDSGGSVYVAGESSASWDTPEAPFSGEWDVFAAKFTPDGTRLWHTFMGSTGGEMGFGIAVDPALDVVVVGQSALTWGAPVQPFGSGYYDGFVAKWITGAPGAPTVLSPAGITGNTSPAYVWMPAGPAAKYDLAVYPQGSPTPVVQGTDLAALTYCQSLVCTYSPGIPLAYGTYQVQARAGNDYGWSEWSPPVGFTVLENVHPVYLPVIIR